ncbi:MAG: transcription-repair coupling factor [Verrucomicrobiota bacterium]|nr:transcription-repair coupling factor [Verrucomicrobiota bacterium]
MTLPSFQTGSFLFERLWESPKAHLAAHIVKETKRSLLLVTGGVREDRLYTDLSYFSSDSLLEFPAWETLPGEEIAPSLDILGKRFEALQELLSRKKPVILLAPLSALLQRVLSPEELAPLLSFWKVGDCIPFSELPERLEKLGYRRASVVVDKGEFALRRGILDLFPIASPAPLRLEFVDEEIESMRSFDPTSQKTTGRVEEFFLSPAQELELLKKAKRLTSIVEYMGKEPLLFWDDLLRIEEDFVSLKSMPGARSALFSSPEEFLERYRALQQVFCAEQSIEELGETSADRFSWLGRDFSAKRVLHAYRPVQPLESLLTRKEADFLFLSAHESEEEEMRGKLPLIPEKARFEKGLLTSGFFLEDRSWAVIPHAEVTGREPLRRQRWRTASHTQMSHFHLLTPGEPVVHFHSGIGRYLGLEKRSDHLGKESEFLLIEYAENSKLYVPISQAHLISRYIGVKEETPTLSQLGSKRWQTTRQNAQQEIIGYAKDLLQIYAVRKARGGFTYPLDGSLMQQFEMDFPYVATDDQKLAISDVKGDMCSAKAMDRLLCGDVGYGKTEVAMRAAFKAVVDGKKQVALLVPTTVLAMQHYETFRARMAPFPVRVALLSRFQSPKEAKKVIEDLLLGEIDILIGTHRLLSKDLEFADLGLLIIDEEQRFGVRAKEKLKKLKEGVDCLTLSATPIPRTLYLSIVHARDLSVINTPPQDRLPVKTILAEEEAQLIQSGLLREFARGGQAFFIHNRVETIYKKKEQLLELVPHAQIGVVHGQMDPDAIEEIFHEFKEGKLNLLLATTIVENGVDIPNANTIIVDQAHAYGLADLYQLKGRVGRWNRPAYAYLLVPPRRSLSEIAHKRLNALVEAQGFGGGMKIAMCDLEIRGAGNLLGVQQSGQISTVGFHLYCKLLKKAVDALKGERPISFHETKIEWPFDAQFPESYIPEFSLRIELYHRLGEASSSEELSAILEEVKDRFGEFPSSVLWLYHMHRIRLFATTHQFSALKFDKTMLIAEKQKGKETEKRSIPLPKGTLTPEVLENYVIQALRHF